MKHFFVVICIALNLFACSQVYAQDHMVKIAKLNNSKEYVLIENTGKTTVNLKGWELHDHDYGKTKIFSYTFSDLALQAGQILQMQSGKTKKEQKESAEPGKLKEAHHYILWANRKVWNDKCDIAYLLDSSGKLIDEKQDGRALENGKKKSCK